MNIKELEINKFLTYSAFNINFKNAKQAVITDALSNKKIDSDESDQIKDDDEDKKAEVEVKQEEISNKIDLLKIRTYIEDFKEAKHAVIQRLRLLKHKYYESK